MARLWYAEVEARLFTYLKTKLTEYLGEKYPHMQFTTKREGNYSPNFHTVYFFQHDSDETLLDLEGSDFNGMYCRVQIEVTSNDEDVSKEVAYYAMAVMKELSFECYFTPKSSATRPGVPRLVARYRRMIGSGDLDIVGE